MKKIGLIALFLLLVSIAWADSSIQAHDALVTLVGTVPSSVYEYNDVDVTINVKNLASSLDTIYNVTLLLDGPNATITSAISPSQWSSSITNNVLMWNTTQARITNGGSLDFVFSLNVNNLLSDSFEDLVVYTTDTAGVTQISSINLSFLNDAVAPTYALNTPLNYSIGKNENTLFNISITEAQSGLGAAGIIYDWGATPSPSVVTSNIALQESGGYYLATINLESGDTDKNYFGFYTNLTDKAGNTNPQVWRYVYVDRVAPSVTVTTPGDGTIISNYSYSYGFTAADNAFGIDTHFDPALSCDLFVDATLKNTVVLTSNSSVGLGASLTGLVDGSHSWYITCTDSAGWSTSSATSSFILDTTGPVISLTTPANNSVIANGTQVQLEVTDSPSNVSAVWYSLDGGATITLLGAAPYTIDSALFAAESTTVTVYANDTHANPSQTAFTFQVDVVAPTVVLVHPADFNYSNGIFMANATDNYAATLQCSLRVDGAVRETKSIGNGQNLSYTLALADGTYVWDVNCTDSVLLEADAVDRTVVVDTTAPSVALVSPLNVAGYNLNNANTNGVSDFTYTIVEEHHDLCTLYINSAQQAQVLSGTNFTAVDFTALGSRNNAYDWYVNCADAAGNSFASATSSVYFDLTNPLISSLSNSSLTTSSAVISWTTDETANATLYYGTTSTDLSTLVMGMANTSAYLSIDSLSASTVYFYVAQSCDQFENCANSSLSNFTTVAVPSSPSSPSGGGGGGGGGGGSLTCNDGFVKVNGVCVPEVVNTTTVAEVSNSEPLVQEEPIEAVLEEEAVPEAETPVGVGQATGLFSRVAGNWKVLAGVVAMLLLVAVLWKTQVLGSLFHKVGEYRAMRATKEEEAVREKLRQQGLIK